MSDYYKDSNGEIQHLGVDYYYWHFMNNLRKIDYFRYLQRLYLDKMNDWNAEWSLKGINQVLKVYYD